MQQQEVCATIVACTGDLPCGGGLPEVVHAREDALKVHVWLAVGQTGSNCWRLVSQGDDAVATLGHCFRPINVLVNAPVAHSSPVEKVVAEEGGGRGKEDPFVRKGVGGGRGSSKAALDCARRTHYCAQHSSADLPKVIKERL